MKHLSGILLYHTKSRTRRRISHFDLKKALRLSGTHPIQGLYLWPQMICDISFLGPVHFGLGLPNFVFNPLLQQIFLTVRACARFHINPLGSLLYTGGHTSHPWADIGHGCFSPTVSVIYAARIIHGCVAVLLFFYLFPKFSLDFSIAIANPFIALSTITTVTTL
jgi:hypothetical protein